MSTITRTARIAWAAEHAELECRVVEVAELAHQALRVERPPLAVARGEPRQPLKAVRRSGPIADLGDLQVMPRNSLVVADRDFSPQREAGLAERRVPRPPGPGEVFARARVVHGRRAARRRDHRLAAPDRLRDVEVHAVQRSNSRVDQT